VYLTSEQREAIDTLAEAKGVTMAEIIRAALDAYLGEQHDGEAVLADTFGSVPDFSASSRRDWRHSNG
jgi:hypothetical protein